MTKVVREYERLVNLQDEKSELLRDILLCTDPKTKEEMEKRLEEVRLQIERLLGF